MSTNLSPAPLPPGRRPVWRWLQRYFKFSRRETAGLVLLLPLTLVLALVPVLLRPEAPTYLPAADQRQLDVWAGTLRDHLDASRAVRKPAYAGRLPPRFGAGAARFLVVPQVHLAPFDPNVLSATEWEARGVPHFVAGRIVNYGQRAGGFRAKSQLQRIYGLPDSVYRRLAPFVQLPEDLPRRGALGSSVAGVSAAGVVSSRFPRKPVRLQPFDLNLADTTQLRQIRGIGRGRAEWIVKHRAELGGYVSEDQLSEVFVLHDAPDLVDSLRKYTFVAPDFAPQPVLVNTATFDKLWPHPYVRKQLARLIVAYRKQHGPYKTPQDLLQIKLLKPEDFERLRPYVRCD